MASYGTINYSQVSAEIARQMNGGIGGGIPSPTSMSPADRARLEQLRTGWALDDEDQDELSALEELERESTAQPPAPRRTRTRALREPQNAQGQIVATAKNIADAKARWMSGPNKLSYLSQDYLTDRQYGLIDQLEKNPKKLYGEPVAIIGGSSSDAFHEFWTGRIMKAFKNGSWWKVTVLFDPNPKLSNPETIMEVYVWCIDQLRDVYLPTKEETANRVLTNLFTEMKRNINYKRASMESKIRDTEAYINDYKKNILKYEHDKKTTLSLLNATKIADFGTPQLDELFKMLNKNKYIEKAIINPKNELIVETNMLYTVDRDKNKETKEKIGRMIFIIPLLSGMPAAYNKDYEYHSGYWHPNISGGSICYGAHGQEITDLRTNGRIYEMVDFLLIFFTTWPHDSGSPHVPHDKWMREKTKKALTAYKVGEEKIWPR